MNQRTIITLTKEEVIQAVQEKYNRENNQKHLLALENAFEIPYSKVEFRIAKWDKDETTH